VPINTRHSGVCGDYQALNSTLLAAFTAKNTRHSGVCGDYQALNSTLLAAFTAKNTRHGGVYRSHGQVAVLPTHYTPTITAQDSFRTRCGEPHSRGTVEIRFSWLRELVPHSRTVHPQRSPSTINWSNNSGVTAEYVRIAVHPGALNGYRSSGVDELWFRPHQAGSGPRASTSRQAQSQPDGQAHGWPPTRQPRPVHSRPSHHNRPEPQYSDRLSVVQLHSRHGLIIDVQPSEVESCTLIWGTPVPLNTMDGRRGTLGELTKARAAISTPLIWAADSLVPLYLGSGGSALIRLSWS